MPSPRPSRPRLLRGGALLLPMLLAACGGGGNGGPISTPPPAPAPTPAPSPTPAPTPTPTSGMPAQQPVASQFNTAEFRRSDGPLEHNAATAWSMGHTGQGVTIAFVDTGVDVSSPEFAGRVSPLSRDILGAGRPLSGDDDHGTHVALVAAAARDGTGILGIAHGATILALRTDSIGSCGPDNPQDAAADCTFADGSIASAVTFASTNGAKVINISLGGEGASPGLRSAVAAAVDRGALIVVAAGNEGLAQPESFAAMLDQAGAGGVIVVGSVNADGRISTFSNRAGSQNTHYMAALGHRICCSYENGRLYVDDEGFVYLISGTSFSTPQVSGAAALLAQAFPNLTGREIADILLRTAFDAGAPGTDAVFGRGILDIARAFQPIGATSLAGTGSPVALGDSIGAGSPAMGDALTGASLPTVVLDSYGRAFESDLAGTLRGAEVPGRLRQAVGVQQRHLAFGSEQTSVAFSIDASGHSRELRLDRADAEQSRVLAARIATQISPGLRLGVAYAESAHGLVAQLQGQARPAFLIAPEAGGDDGAVHHSDASFALRRQLGAWGLTASTERGETLSGADMRRAAEMKGRRLESGFETYGLSLDRRFGEIDAALGLERMVEQRTLLGARFHDAFGLAGSGTLFLDARAGWNLAPGWRAGGSVRQGWTAAREGGLIAPGSTLVSRAWALDLERRGVFADSDSLAFRLSQPLRVESGALDLVLPASYSYETLLADYGLRTLSLTPRGRELMAEIAWRGPLLSGHAAASLFYRREPGHYEALPDDKGAAVRWSAKF